MKKRLFLVICFYIILTNVFFVYGNNEVSAIKYNSNTDRTYEDEKASYTKIGYKDLGNNILQEPTTGAKFLLRKWSNLDLPTIHATVKVYNLNDVEQSLYICSKSAKDRV